MSKKKRKWENEEYLAPGCEVLTQNDIDMLMRAINDESFPEDRFPEERTRRIKIYDFKRPDKFIKEHIYSISNIFDTFARLTTTALSAQLRSMVHVHVAAVDQLTFEEFIRSIPTPTTLAVINPDPLKYNWILEIDPAVTFSIIDRLLGGIGEGIKNQHELTDIEASLMEGIIVRMLGNLREAFNNIIDLRPRLGQLDTNPQFVQIVPPNEMVVLVTLEARVGDVEGMINVCMPHLSLEPIIDKLCRYFIYNNYGTPQQLDPQALVNVNTTVRAEYFRTVIKLGELFKLKKDDVIFAPQIQVPFTGKVMVDNLRIGTFKDHPYFDKYRRFKIVYDKKFVMESDYMEEKHNVQFSSDVLNVNVQIIAELGRTKMPIGKILGMSSGEIIELDKLAGEPVNIFANNVLIGTAEVCVIDEKFGIRMIEIANPMQDQQQPFALPNNDNEEEQCG